MNADDASIGALAIAGGIALLARHHAYPEKFSPRLRPSTLDGWALFLSSADFCWHSGICSLKRFPNGRSCWLSELESGKRTKDQVVDNITGGTNRGWGGIRTPGAFRHTRFPGVHNRPLCHPSERKLQIPSTKLQRNSKLQTPLSAALSRRKRAQWSFWSLGFGASLELGCWSLALS